MPNQEFTIGRGESCDIQVGGRLTEEVHARLIVEEDTMTIEDLGSQFGTFVNGASIKKPTVLKPKDRVKIGTQLFHWQSYHNGVEASEYDPNPIYFKDLFTYQGEISRSNYSFILLFTAVAPLVIIFGVPYLIMLLDYTTRERFTVYLEQSIEPGWFVLGGVVAYVFLLQSIKRYRTWRKTTS